MNRTIYVDFDDVLCETARVLAAMIKAEFGKDTAYEKIDSFDLTKSFKLNEAETLRLFEIFHDYDVLMGIVPIAGAAEVFREWRKMGLKIHIVTGRPPATFQVSSDWLKKYGFEYDRLSFVDKYERNHTPVEGVDILTLDDLKLLKFCAAIDDSPIAISFLVENTENPVIVFDRPWNTDIGESGNSPQITRCRTWDEIEEHTKQIFNR
jgi:5'(3')-deoxyribonucleotidase